MQDYGAQKKNTSSKMQNSNTPLVSIICTVYNHEPYLRQCLDGFVMQQTNFPFEIIIHDDASTDESAKIISEYADEYPNLFVPILQKENQYSKGVKIGITFMYPIAKGKYIAECEGDDYWTDPLKLQKQVDFLEANPEYSMCFHKSKIHKEVELDCALRVDMIETRDYTGNELVGNWIVPTASIMFRKECLTYPIKNREKLINGDLPLVLSCCAMGKVRGFSDCMSVYRIQVSGLTYDKARQKDINKRFPMHYKTIHKNFPFVDKSILNRLIAYHLFEIAKMEDRKIMASLNIVNATLTSPRYAIKRLVKLIKKRIM